MADSMLDENSITDFPGDKLNDSNASDILQQALKEASYAFGYESVENVVAATQVIKGNTVPANDSLVSKRAHPDANGSTRVVPQPSPPLGSSENPIQIIQQGNTYHSTQHLTQDQMQQIAHVLQQQATNKPAPNAVGRGVGGVGRGSTVLYNSATNTRIVYRVIYPSEFLGKQETGRRGRGRGRPRRSRAEEEESKADVPNMSQEERQEKKKHRPRTRYGRISKPPSYMMKDYKRIHHLDFDQDAYDDSDGGYSDYQISDEDREKVRTSSLPAGVSTSKPRNYHCRTCDKAYIGHGGLARHYRLNSSHGNIAELGEGVDMSNDENSNCSSVSLGEMRPRDDTPPATAKHQHSYYARRRAKLKELIRAYHDEELMEVVLPRLAEIMSLWEFLLLKAEMGSSAEPNLPDIFRHFESLVKQLQKLAKDHLVPSASPLVRDDNKCYVEILNKQVANALGLSAGIYEVQKWTFDRVRSFLNCNRNTGKRSSGDFDDCPPRKRTQFEGNDSPPKNNGNGLLDLAQGITSEKPSPPSSKDSAEGFCSSSGGDKSYAAYAVSKDPVISAAAIIPPINPLQSVQVHRVEIASKDGIEENSSSLLSENRSDETGFEEDDTSKDNESNSQFTVGDKDCEVLQQCLGQEGFQLVSHQNGSDQSKDVKDVIQLVVPEGPILGALSPGGQFESFLPSNIVVVQNADGTTTLQLPGDQTIPLETIQALLAVEQTHDTGS